MKLYEITSHQWAIIETMHDAWQIDATREESDYTLAQQPSATYNGIVKQEIKEHGERSTTSELIERGGIASAEDDEILVYEGTVDGEWCRVYIPTYWD